MPETLGDIGERRIVEEILPRFVAGIGDDCAILEAGSTRIVVTTDPVPEPAAGLLGGDADPYWMGWLLVIINASDLAAAGASPLGFVAALEAEPSFEVAHFERLLAGIRDGCAAEGLAYVGGNLREGKRTTGVGMALGVLSSGEPLRRSSIQSGDVLVSVGQGGVFWRDVFRVRFGHGVDKEKSPLFKPRSQIRAMARLHSSKVLHAAMDVSDGLLPTLSQLARASQVTIRLDLDRLAVPDYDPDICEMEPARLWLGWGDWNVVAALSPDVLSEAQAIGAAEGTAIVPIGEALDGPSQVLVARGGTTELAPRIESERFAKDSWFAKGIDEYIRILGGAPLP